ncbi:MAG: glycosyltransferase family 8 protein [Bacillales bacterium]|nr:glycosyltransferase family 8 protein [Bacillales bacterium]
MKTIPIFFAADNNYAGPLSATIISIRENRSKAYNYRLVIMTDNMNEENRKMLSSVQEDKFTIEFKDVNDCLQTFKEKLVLRDYYTLSTYFRFFIPELFPEYSKALYLDSDLIITGDISKLFNTFVGPENYVGGINDDVVPISPIFSEYVEKIVGVSRYRYFNAGVLLMNLKLFREEKIIEKFIEMVGKKRFVVAQDQDYLNALCKDRVQYIGHGWNKTAFFDENFDDNKANLVHFKMSFKPWHYNGVHYEDRFWKYAEMSPFYNQLISTRDNYSKEEQERDKLAGEGLLNLAIKEVEDQEREMASDNEGVFYQKF